MSLSNILEQNRSKLESMYYTQDYKSRYRDLASAFDKRFGIAPTAFISAPGRIEVVGNHTDHNRGRVLAAAVNLDTLAAVAPSGDSVVRLYSEGFAEPFVVDVHDLDAVDCEAGTTNALIRGVASKLVQLGYKIGGFYAQVTSTVLKGSGLSSSAAFEIMLAGIFDALFNGWTIDPKLKAKIGQYAENIYFKKPSGLMDQTASAVGGLVFIDFGPDDPIVSAVKYDFSKSGYSVCVVATPSEHANLTDSYAVITGEMAMVSKALNIDKLNRLSVEELEAALPRLKKLVPDRAILRALHFVDETERSKAAIEALSRDDLSSFFSILNTSCDSSWRLLQNLYVEGTPHQELPLALEASRRILRGRGACRINGGGFAGTIVAFVPDDLLPCYIEQMNALFGAGSAIILNIRSTGVALIG